MPSTHVVYEGFKETKLDISETAQPVPELTYSTGKVQSEVDLVKSDKDYVTMWSSGPSNAYFVNFSSGQAEHIVQDLIDAVNVLARLCQYICYFIRWRF